MTRYVWFWTFWHWSKESFRSGSLLLRPLQGVGSHWDEWYRHEASENDLKAIEAAGRNESTQRQFIAWLHQHWLPETPWQTNRVIPKYILGQLADFSPFNGWRTLEKYRVSYGLGGISAVVLAEGSMGESTDVREVEAVALPFDDETVDEAVLTESFHADREDLEMARQATANQLAGKGLLAFLGLWIASGRRPYRRWLKLSLNLGWLTAGGLILYLVFGPDPGEKLTVFIAGLTVLWSILTFTAVTMISRQCLDAWRLGRAWSAQLARSQIRFHMNGELTLKGGSAGLPFCLNTLLSLYRARPSLAHRSWLWHNLFDRLHASARSWAATGVITKSGFLKPVVIDPKIRACLRHTEIRHLLTPRQHDAAQHAIHKTTDEFDSIWRSWESAGPAAQMTRLGFAAEKPELRSHPCRHLAQCLMTIGNFSSRGQLGMNCFAVVVSIVMLAALPDIHSVLLPFSPPAVVAPASPLPNYLWVSLDTQHPRYFEVVLESDFWKNRRIPALRYGGANASVRAEVLLQRLSRAETSDENNGVIWVERRHCFLAREFNAGERVGRYTLPYLNSLGYQ